MRIWKDSTGEHQITAEFLSLSNGQVILKRENGVTIRLPITSLSPQDQVFITETQTPIEDASDAQEEIKLIFPRPMFIGSPKLNLPNLEAFDPAKFSSKRFDSFLAPKGTLNIAKGKKVTSSDPAPIIGELALVTDGDADSADGSFVELAPGKQWLQIDLEAPHKIQKIALWHFHKMPQAYIDVIIQASNDAEFKTGITTLWNSDHDNSSGLGKGSDPAYIETNHGRLIAGKATSARYIRLWSNGNTSNDMNHYCEVQIFAVSTTGATATAPAMGK